MEMKFKKLEEPVFTTDIYYDLFEGGNIDPENILENPFDAKKVSDAIDLIRHYLAAAEQSGSLETG